MVVEMSGVSPRRQEDGRTGSGGWGWRSTDRGQRTTYRNTLVGYPWGKDQRHQSGVPTEGDESGTQGLDPGWDVPAVGDDRVRDWGSTR